jgi:hypothetical protein
MGFAFSNFQAMISPEGISFGHVRRNDKQLSFFIDSKPSPVLRTTATVPFAETTSSCRF